MQAVAERYSTAHTHPHDHKALPPTGKHSHEHDHGDALRFHDRDDGYVTAWGYDHDAAHEEGRTLGHSHEAAAR